MRDEIGEAWPEIVILETNQPAGYEDYGNVLTDLLRQMAVAIDELQDSVAPNYRVATDVPFCSDGWHVVEHEAKRCICGLIGVTEPDLAKVNT